MGIIDILTYYGAAKSMEYTFKYLVNFSTSMSCVPPDKYSSRFSKFLNECFKAEDK